MIFNVSTVLIFLDLLTGTVVLSSLGQYYSATGVWDYMDLAINVSQMTSLVVRMQGCCDGHVAVTDKPGMFLNDHMYEWVFGGYSNTQIIIRRTFSNPDLATLVTTDILDCNNPRWYWVSWGNSIVQCGSGNIPGLNKLLQYNDPTPLTILGAGVATYYEPVNFSVYDSYRKPALSRTLSSLKFAKVASDSYLNDTCLARITLPQSSPNRCGTFCSKSPRCTAFNMRTMTSTSPSPIYTCELQDRVPWPVEDFQREVGSSYWIIK